jgi:1-deoxy-D-xylulose-5-phosphate synthase
VKKINSGPKIVHVITKKGRGFLPAENDPCSFHGIGPFERDSGEKIKNGDGESYSSVAGRTLAEIGKRDKKVVAVTAAMKEGTGLSEFEKVAPDRTFDVGIAEQHAVTFSAALASTGLKPFVPMYSTFLQRAYDQLIQDAALMKLPVRLLIDRAGVVGDDGETHHGLFDISMIRNIPDFQFFAPSNGEELRDMIYYAWKNSPGPTAIRYPRGSSGPGKINVKVYSEFKPGRIKILKKGKDIAIFALGDMVATALDTGSILKKERLEATVVNLISIKPLDINGIERVIRGCRKFITLENGFINGGVGEYIYSNIDPSLCSRRLFAAGFPEKFIKHGNVNELFREYGLNPQTLSDSIFRYFSAKKK